MLTKSTLLIQYGMSSLKIRRTLVESRIDLLHVLLRGTLLKISFDDLKVVDVGMLQHRLTNQLLQLEHLLAGLLAHQLLSDLEGLAEVLHLQQNLSLPVEALNAHTQQL